MNADIKEKLYEMKALKVHKINLYQVLNFIIKQKIKNKNIKLKASKIKNSSQTHFTEVHHP